MHGGRGLPLIASDADQKLIEVLGDTYSHVLALVLHERHGWRIRAFGEPAGHDSRRSWRGLEEFPRHVYCLNDAAQPVDVNGVFESEDAIRRYYPIPWAHKETLITVDLSPEEVENDLVELGYPRVSRKELSIVRRHADRLALHLLAVA